MKFILGKKIGMTQVFRPDGTVMAVTRVQAGPCVVTQVNKNSVQLGFGETPEWRLSEPQKGHLRGLAAARHLREFKTENVAAVERGAVITAETFAVGDVVEVSGVSKGKGFAGVVKRHHFAGGPASHGHKDNLRAPGSIGAGGVQRVFKGMRMAGHMGADRVTVKNLEVMAVNPQANEIYIKGALPGGRNALLEIVGDGELKIMKKPEVQPEAPTAAATQEPVPSV